MDVIPRFQSRIADTRGDVVRAQRLRALVFGLDHLDVDSYDDFYTTVLIFDRSETEPVACFRFQRFTPHQGFCNSYAAAHYDLSNFAKLDHDAVELGRLAVHPDHNSPDIMRVVWAYLTDYVDRLNIGLLFGCTSFAGTDPDTYLDCFDLLRAAHLAPKELRPLVKSPEIVAFGQSACDKRPNVMAARRLMPSLLRSYLGMGGWVSDHAVIDRKLNTLHVLTGVEIAKIPEARKRLLRADAAVV